MQVSCYATTHFGGNIIPDDRESRTLMQHNAFEIHVLFVTDDKVDVIVFDRDHGSCHFGHEL